MSFYAEKKGVAVIARGSMVNASLSVPKELEKEGQLIKGLNGRFIKPLSKKELKEIIEIYDKILIVEEHTL